MEREYSLISIIIMCSYYHEQHNQFEETAYILTTGPVYNQPQLSRTNLFATDLYTLLWQPKLLLRRDQIKGTPLKNSQRLSTLPVKWCNSPNYDFCEPLCGRFLLFDFGAVDPCCTLAVAMATCGDFNSCCFCKATCAATCCCCCGVSCTTCCG